MSIYSSYECRNIEDGLKVSLFELAPHPLVDVRLSDIVFIPPEQQSQDERSVLRICCCFC